MSYGMIWYLLGVLGHINKVTEIGFIMGAIGCMALILGLAIGSDSARNPGEHASGYEQRQHKEWHDFLRGLKWAALPTTLLGLLLIVLPSKKDATIILGLSLAQTPIESVIKDAGEFYDPLKTLLKQELEGLIEVKSGGNNESGK